jgi:hypothetical protein
MDLLISAEVLNMGRSVEGPKERLGLNIPSQGRSAAFDE